MIHYTFSQSLSSVSLQVSYQYNCLKSCLICTPAFLSLVDRRAPNYQPSICPTVEYKFSSSRWSHSRTGPNKRPSIREPLGSFNYWAQSPVVPTLQRKPNNPAPLKHFTRSACSVKSIEQEENGADADHCAEDEGVPSLPQVDSLDEIVDGWETV